MLGYIKNPLLGTDTLQVIGYIYLNGGSIDIEYKLFRSLEDLVGNVRGPFLSDINIF